MKTSSAAARARARANPFMTPRSLARHIIEYDAEDPSTYAPHTMAPPAVMAASTLNPIPWPAGRAPVPAPMPKAPRADRPLPQFDYLVVTWTVAEARCLADILTPGYPSKTAWYPYTHKFKDEYVPLIRKFAPALQAKRLGSWFPTVIAGKRVMCFKSELHLSQDGQKMPIAKLWEQLIAETRPKLVITTGTAGGIGASIELGDVVVAKSVRFDCLREFKAQPFHATTYACSKLATGALPKAVKLFAANTDHLPAAARAPLVFTKSTAKVALPQVVTTDFFAFDDSDNTYGLRGLGAAVEMGDAVLGMVIKKLGAAAPKWTAIRNASDPQISSTGLTKKEEAMKAAQIYERYGYWTTIPSAISSWAMILSN